MKSNVLVATVAEWYRHRIVAGFVTSWSPVPLKTHRVGQRCTLNLSRAEMSSRWCGVVVRRGGASSVFTNPSPHRNFFFQIFDLLLTKLSLLQWERSRVANSDALSGNAQVARFSATKIPPLPNVPDETVSDHGRHLMISSPVPLKTRRVRERCTLNLSRAQTSSRWCDVVVRKGGTSSGVILVT
ncbi:uncharacterized protein TNCV_1242771 [Trichonephila clavipes]|nr:uncharacterized protein TNCV_1242771 [Trichonephila clavipes]